MKAREVTRPWNIVGDTWFRQQDNGAPSEVLFVNKGEENWWKSFIFPLLFPFTSSFVPRRASFSQSDFEYIFHLRPHHKSLFCLSPDSDASSAYTNRAKRDFAEAQFFFIEHWHGTNPHQLFVGVLFTEEQHRKPQTNINQTIILQSDINSNNFDLIWRFE